VKFPPGRDALGESHRNGVAAHTHADHWDGLGCGLRWPGARHAASDNDVNFELDEFLRQLSESCLALGGLQLESQVLTFPIAELS
jgi:hypothetical protein